APYPNSKVTTVDSVRIGAVHGHQVIPWGDAEALSIAARQLDVDVLVTGHTHAFSAYERDGKFFVNPGSATGAFSNFTSDVTPSFVLMDVQGDNIVTYVYRLVDGEVKVEKLEYRKVGCIGAVRVTSLDFWRSAHAALCADARFSVSFIRLPGFTFPPPVSPIPHPLLACGRLSQPQCM
ncbi:MAG: Metallo-dependent phosphatase-like protein, partial [Olpidium bornovanus]